MIKRDANINLLLTKDGQYFSSLPLPVSGFEEEQIDRVYTKMNTVYAVGVSGRCYTWGDLRHGLSLNPSMSRSETPIRCKTLEAMNFSDITFSEQAAVGIGSSIQLHFSFPDIPGPEDDDPQLNKMEATVAGQKID